MIQKLADRLIDGAWMFANRYGFDSFRKDSRRQHLPHSKPGEVIKRLSPGEREEVKKMKPKHFDHEMMFK